jgi:hypothetical protein
MRQAAEKQAGALLRIMERREMTEIMERRETRDGRGERRGMSGCGCPWDKIRLWWTPSGC